MYIGTKKHNKREKGRRSQNGKRSSTRTAVTRSIGPTTNIGDRAWTTLRYIYIGTLSLSGLNYAENIFRMNSLFDPDFSGAGAQPLGFDQWAAFYTRYRVLRAKAKVMFAAPTSLTECSVGLIPNLVNTIDVSGPSVYAEPNARYSIFSTNGGWKPELEVDMRMEKLFGVNAQQFGEEGYSALTSANPLNVAWLHVRCETVSGGLSGSVSYILTIDYDVEFYQRVELELSLWKDYVDFRKTKEEKSLVAQKQPEPSAVPQKSMDDRPKELKELLDRLLK